jgi:hypothetical protein
MEKVMMSPVPKVPGISLSRFLLLVKREESAVVCLY